jgi:hypothetical protein
MVCILYCRVSTAEQTLEHQATLARNAGFEMTKLFPTTAFLASVPLAERPQGKRLFDMLRAGDVLAVRWLDRLGRNYGDVTRSVQKFMQRGVIIKTVIKAWFLTVQQKTQCKRRFATRCLHLWRRLVKPKRKQRRSHNALASSMPRKRASSLVANRNIRAGKST